MNSKAGKNYIRWNSIPPIFDKRTEVQSMAAACGSIFPALVAHGVALQLVPVQDGLKQRPCCFSEFTKGLLSKEQHV